MYFYGKVLYLTFDLNLDGNLFKQACLTHSSIFGADSIECHHIWVSELRHDHCFL